MASPPGLTVVPEETPTQAMAAGASPVAHAVDTPARSTAQNMEAKEAPAMRTVALDLGVRKICLCEVADDLVVRRVTGRSLRDLDPYIGPGTPPARVAFEACREAWHVHDTLAARGHQPIIIDTTRVLRIGVGQHGAKTDRRDAEALARALARGIIPVAHVLSHARRELREQLCTRGAMVETRARYITTLRGIGRAHGIMLPTCSPENFTARVRGAAELPKELLAHIEPMLRVMDALDQQLAEVETRLEVLARGAPEIALLATVPGVGLIVAATFVGALDDAGRFRDAHSVEAYLGLVPCEDSSGGRRRLGAITKQGNPWARAALVQAAHVLLSKGPEDDPLKAWALAVAARRGKMIAVIALARRLTGVLWAMWRKGRSYDPRRLAARSAAGLEIASEETARLADEQTAIARAEHKIYPRTRPRRTSKSSRAAGAAPNPEVTVR